MMEGRNNETTPENNVQPVQPAAGDDFQSINTSAGNDVHAAMLNHINALQQELGEDGVRYKKVPEILEADRAVLQGRNVLMVDDTGFHLSDWMAVLVAATDGNCSFVLHQEQSPAELIEQIVAKNPEILLLDYALANEITGTALLSGIRDALPDCLIIGFSSDKNYNQQFLRAGVKYTANKGNLEWGALSTISQHVTSFLSSEGVPETWKKVGYTKIQTEESPIESAFNARLGMDSVVEAISTVSSHVLLKDSTDEGRHISQLERRQLGAERHANVLQEICDKYESPFRKFLAVLSEESYYHPLARETTVQDSEYYNVIFQQLDRLVSLLPDTIQPVTSQAELVSSALNDTGQFALLFNSEPDVRYVVTNKDFIELNNVYGYKYLDVGSDGAPFIRCRTERGGGRAFFDGERLMSHEFFKTCAPRVDFFEGGYIVNSTNCTIVNGLLYPLINEEDRVAVTTGAWLDLDLAIDEHGSPGINFMVRCDFTTREALASYEQNKDLAAQIQVDEAGTIHMKDRVIEPLGRFLPSEVTIQPNGFAHYEWSKFEWLR